MSNKHAAEALDEGSGQEGLSQNEANRAVKYIIPISVAIGLLLAAITIGCVCYRRWAFLRRFKKQRKME